MGDEEVTNFRGSKTALGVTAEGGAVAKKYLCKKNIFESSEPSTRSEVKSNRRKASQPERRSSNNENLILEISIGAVVFLAVICFGCCLRRGRARDRLDLNEAEEYL